MGAVEIASALAASRRAVRLYPPEHPTHREALADLCKTVTESVDIRPLVLNLREGRLYEASEVINDTSPATRALAQAMEDRRVESMTFHMGFTAVDGEGISEVLGLRPSPELQVQAELDARGVTAVSVSELEDNSARQAEARDRQREADRALFRRALASAESLRTSLVEGAEIDTSTVLRTVVPFLERIAEDPQAVLALSQLTGHGERWRFHAVGVMLGSVVLGHLLGLPERQLLVLGAAALTHDYGAVLMQEADADTVRLTHPEVGARALSSIADEDCTIVLVAYEHHMHSGGAGWPPAREGYVLHPFTDIIAVADRFDELTRPAAGAGMRPDEAVSHMLREAREGALDPLVTRVFTRAVGVIPSGCVVRLSDHSVGVVCGAGDDALRPSVRLVLGIDGTELHPVRDLALGESTLDIIEILPAELVSLKPSDYL